MKITIYVREKYLEPLNYFINNKVSKPHNITWETEQHEFVFHRHYEVTIDYDDFVRLKEWEK